MISRFVESEVLFKNPMLESMGVMPQDKADVVKGKIRFDTNAVISIQSSMYGNGEPCTQVTFVTGAIVYINEGYEAANKKIFG